MARSQAEVGHRGSLSASPQWPATARASDRTVQGSVHQPSPGQGRVQGSWAGLTNLPFTTVVKYGVSILTRIPCEWTSLKGLLRCSQQTPGSEFTSSSASTGPVGCPCPSNTAAPFLPQSQLARGRHTRRLPGLSAPPPPRPPSRCKVGPGSESDRDFLRCSLREKAGPLGASVCSSAQWARCSFPSRLSGATLRSLMWWDSTCLAERRCST